jgi:hypothetical protein
VQNQAPRFSYNKKRVRILKDKNVKKTLQKTLKNENHKNKECSQSRALELFKKGLRENKRFKRDAQIQEEFSLNVHEAQNLGKVRWSALMPGN